MVLNTDNDKLGGISELHKMPRNIILNNLENFNLTDIWHHLHPQEKQFTYFKLKSKNVFSGLDYFLISDGLIHLKKKAVQLFQALKLIIPVLNLHLTLRARPRGYGTLLYDTEYILKVKDSFKQTVQDNPNTDNDILFDIIKCNIRCLSMQYIGEKRHKDKQTI